MGQQFKDEMTDKSLMLIKKFPDSSQIGSAKREIFKATIKKWPDNRKRILEAADRLIQPPGKSGAKAANIQEYQFIAKELLGAGIFPGEAEKLALKSLAIRRMTMAAALIMLSAAVERDG